MPPPPPPPPGPPPPPALSGGPAKVASKSGAPDRNQLLSQIKQGAALKPTVTNDRSKPILTPSKPTAMSGPPAPSPSGPSKPPGNGMGPPNLGGLFAGGMPKLRPAGSAGRGAENRTNGNQPAGGPRQFGGSNPSIANKNAAFQRQTSNSSTDLVDRAAPQPPNASNKPRIAPVKPNLAPKPPVPDNKPTSPTVTSPPPFPNGPGAGNFTRKASATSLNKPPPPPASQPPPPPLPCAKPNIGRAESMRANHGKDKAPPLPPPNFNTLPRNPPPPPPPSQSTPPIKTPSFSRGPLPQIPNGAAPSPTRENSRPSERPPPPPPQRMNPPMAIPPPPPTAAPPPPPPHRTAPPPQPPTATRNGGVTNGRTAPAAPTPPQRNSSMRSNGSVTSLVSATGSMNSLAGYNTDDFESRFQDRFRPVQMLPPPEPFTNCPKSYPSRLALNHSAKRQQAPQPPMQYQFGNRN